MLCFLGKIKLSYLFVVVGLNKVFPIIEPRGKCQDNSRVFYVVQKRNRQAIKTNRNVKLLTIVVGVFNRNLPC